LAVVVVDIEFAVVVVYIVVHVAVADDFVVFGPVVVDWVLSGVGLGIFVQISAARLA